jgi:hypothetical protein
LPLALGVISCKKLIEVDAPIYSINSENIYTNDATTASVLTGIYSKMSQTNGNWSGVTSLFLYGSLSVDELTLYDVNNTAYNAYYTNTLNNSNTGFDYWIANYQLMYDANAVIEGLNSSSGLTSAVKQQALGEAYFLRAFFYFYLINLYGDVPLVISTDYTVNTLLPRSSQTKVWQQVIGDLHIAQNLLSADFLDASLLKTTADRVRPTKWAATALLARAYLYTGNWTGADSAASVVIENTSQFGLGTFSGSNRVFAKNSTETIWALQGVGSNPPNVNSHSTINTGEGLLFVLPTGGPNTSGTYPVYLSNAVLNAFEPDDQRKTNWVGSVTANGVTYNYPYKYQAGGVSSGSSEYSIQLRLAEQFLIRAEAEAHEAGKADNAVVDLNMIRSRAGLSDYTGGTDLASLQAAILHERQVELFTEGGHRWFDLKRTNTIDLVMGTDGACAAKGGTWNSNWQWFPLPLTELQANPNLTQNADY